jgi:hypothetical protein
MGASTKVRKGAPDRTWQSAQWQSVTPAGSISAVNEINPQRQAPSICISALSISALVNL